MALTLMTGNLSAPAQVYGAGDWLSGQHPLTHSPGKTGRGIIGLGRIGKGIAERAGT